jgi:hypothetical protein
MFELIVADETYETIVWSRPDDGESLLGEDNAAEGETTTTTPTADDNNTNNNASGGGGQPWIMTIDNFLTQDEANVLIHYDAEVGYDQSELSGDIDEETGEILESSLVEEDRTSSNSW